jgi:hypothetical protein
LAFFGWVLPVVVIDFVDFGSFDTSFSDFDDLTFTFPGLAATVLNEFSFANFAWVVFWRFANWSIADFATLWNWWASTFVFVATWVFWMWSFNLFYFTFSRVASDFFKVFTASSGFTSVSAFFWFTSETVVALSFGFAENLGSHVTSWWTWSIDDLGVNRTDTVFSDAVVDDAIVFPWFTTWLVNVTQVFAFTFYNWDFTFVRIATVTWLFVDSVDDGIGSSAEIDGQWFFLTSWWADTSFLHAHARIGDMFIDLFTDVFLSLFIKIASVVDSRGNFIAFTNKFRVGWKSEFFAVVVTFGVSAAVSFTATSVNFNGGVLVWFAWSWGNTSWGYSFAFFFVVNA